MSSIPASLQAEIGWRHAESSLDACAACPSARSQMIPKITLGSMSRAKGQKVYELNGWAKRRCMYMVHFKNEACPGRFKQPNTPGPNVCFGFRILRLQKMMLSGVGPSNCPVRTKQKPCSFSNATLDHENPSMCSIHQKSSSSP